NLKSIMSETNIMVIPLYDKLSLIGFVNVAFDNSEAPQFTPNFIKAFQVAIYQISSAVINYQLNEQMKINAEFYG
ncbi:hypothetical protein IJS77_01275, partial [bacterium]|nr:hypothetical protein [bacterium]